MDIHSTTAQPPHLLKMLAHALRWQIVTSLAHGDLRVQELVDRLAQPQNLVSYHLKHLREAGLVIERRSTADARDVYYSVDLVQLATTYAALGVALHPALVTSLPSRDSQSKRTRAPKRILFLCTENSARSQMAEALLRQMGGTAIEAFSAGTAPSTVHPSAIRVLAERDVDIHEAHAKAITDFYDQAFDIVITVCDRARENCPVFPGDVERIHWSLPDPAAIPDANAQYQAFEQTAQQLTIRIRYLLTWIDRKEIAA